MAGLAGFSEQDCDRISLAVDEACSNVIRHSYKERSDGEIIIKCSLERNGLSISVRDFGEKFDAAAIQPRDPDEVKPGGLGVHMIKSIMDEVDYDCSHEVGTEIRMKKYAHPEEN